MIVIDPGGSSGPGAGWAPLLEALNCRLRIHQNIILCGSCSSLLLQDFEDKHEAMRDFEFLYEEKTGNKWKNRESFKKVGVSHLVPPSLGIGGW